jgi:quercetin dioxygenase-like cupin family protein
LFIDNDLGVLNLYNMLDPKQDLARWLFTVATSQMKLNVAVPQHSIKLGTVDVKQFVNELSDSWKQTPAQILAQRERLCISLIDSAQPWVTPSNSQQVTYTEEYDKHPKLVKYLHDFCRENDSILQRAMVVKLEPGKKIHLHFDIGTYFFIRDRYHIVLKSKGSTMEVLNQKHTFHEGEVWWFNNKVHHRAYNDTDEDRIHVIFDALPMKNLGLRDYFADMM